MSAPNCCRRRGIFSRAIAVALGQKNVKILVVATGEHELVIAMSNAAYLYTGGSGETASPPVPRSSSRNGRLS